jgi:hypothetical protein
MNSEKSLSEMLEKEAKKLETKKDEISRKLAKIDHAITALRALKPTVAILSKEIISGLVVQIRREIEANREVLHSARADAATDRHEPLPRDIHYEGTIFERIVQFFQANGNLPATNAEIRTAIGAMRGTVAMVLYKTHSDKFKIDGKNGPRKATWCLTDSYLRELESGDD